MWEKIFSGIISGGYAGDLSYKNGAGLKMSILTGVILGVLTSASLSNIATLAGKLGIWVSATLDLILGTGYNSMSAITYKTVVDNANRNK